MSATSLFVDIVDTQWPLATETSPRRLALAASTEPAVGNTCRLM